MRILIATGIYPPDPGGPAYYARSLAQELRSLGNEVRVVAYYPWERKFLPSGVRHLWYFLKLMPAMAWANASIILDTFSAAFPAVIAAWLFRVKTILRTGGDFLWEQYVERTHQPVLLREFYGTKRKFSLKEQSIFHVTRFVLHHVNQIAFSTGFQRDIFISAYGLTASKTCVIENYYAPAAVSAPISQKKVFLWAGRRIRFKNIDMMEQAFADIARTHPDITLRLVETMPQDKLLDEISRAYAVVYPSLTEISPNFILEAIQNGVPFVSTRENGLYERIKDLGLFVDPRKPEDIARGVIALADEMTNKRYRGKIAAFTYTHSYRQIAKEFIASISHL